ncbi:MAG: aspartate ammonia-lyase [Candidatus Parvarchaeota archaeon]|jgi:aspartate ammonia-lyase|nr:aspartate ammonia-lyase [Candidatus Parvarchaeota archaeon]
MNQFRIEKDYLGEVKVPPTAYWGVQTQRALNNFQISGITPIKEYTYSIVLIKKAAALANSEINLLEKKKANVIVQACNEILEGKFDNQFLVDIYQAGEGTSNNMNVNEVIANIAIEKLGKKRGDYSVIHPNDDVNMGQSSNDVIPTATKIAALKLSKELIKSLEELKTSFLKKSVEFDRIIKSGRTHLMDAAPIRLGQEFKAWSDLIKESVSRIEETNEELEKINLGATAVGTGINADPRYVKKAISYLKNWTGLKLKQSEDLPAVTESPSDLLGLSSAITILAADLIKIANDLRLMNSGPITGLAEIVLPAVQPGSSIMPGKVNPSIAEMVDMVCFRVMGDNQTIELATQAGQFELNVMEPIINYCLLHDLTILRNACKAFAEKSINDIKVNKEKIEEMVNKTPGVGLALNPYIGYEKSAEIVKTAIKEGKTIKQVAEEENVLEKGKLEKIFDPFSLTTSKRLKSKK